MIPRESVPEQQSLNGRGDGRPAWPLSNTAPATGGGIYGTGAGVPLQTEKEVSVAEAGVHGTLRQEFSLFQQALERALEQAVEIALDRLTAEAVQVRGLLNRRPVEQRTVRVTGEVRLLQKIIEQWGFGETEAAKLLGYEDASVVQALYTGKTRLRTVDEKDRLRAILRIAGDLHSLFRDDGEIRGWLREPKARLGGKSAYDLMMNGSMEYLLYVRQFVEFLSGR